MWIFFRLQQPCYQPVLFSCSISSMSGFLQNFARATFGQWCVSLSLFNKSRLTEHTSSIFPFVQRARHAAHCWRQAQQGRRLLQVLWLEPSGSRPLVLRFGLYSKAPIHSETQSWNQNSCYWGDPNLTLASGPVFSLTGTALALFQQDSWHKAANEIMHHIMTYSMVLASWNRLPTFL